MDDILYEKIRETNVWKGRMYLLRIDENTLRTIVDRRFNELSKRAQERITDRLMQEEPLDMTRGHRKDQIIGNLLSHLCMNTIRSVDSQQLSWKDRTVYNISKNSSRNALLRCGIYTYGEFAYMTCEELLKKRNVGVTALKDYAAALEKEAGDDAQETPFMLSYKGGAYEYC